MFLIAGLGNPGPRYADNRHNIGFMAVDAIADSHGFSPWSRKFKAEIADGVLDGEKVLLVKPQTLMNLSGEAVGEAMRFYKLTLDELVVIHDDLDLAAGKARIKTGGGHGGHNGLKSIDAHCAKAYRRLRLGIGHPGAKEMVHNHVLGDFAKADKAWLDPLMDAIGMNAGLLVNGRDSQFMNKLALAVGGKDGHAHQEAGPAGQHTNQKNAPAKAAGRSHIRQARQQKPADIPKSGPMADMLKKLFGGGE